MGTFLKYLFYLILIIVAYLIGRGIYDGSIDRETTVGQVEQQVDDGMKNMATNTENSIEKAVDTYKQKASSDNQNTK